MAPASAAASSPNPAPPPATSSSSDQRIDGQSAPSTTRDRDAADGTADRTAARLSVSRT
jgi:hypothetical protein